MENPETISRHAESIHFGMPASMKSLAARSAALLVGLVAAISLGGCVEAPGSVKVSFKWSAPPTVPVWVWARIEERIHPAQEGKTLITDGPFEYVHGTPPTIDLNDVPNGNRRHVVVEFREGPNTGLPVIFYGISASFELAPGKDQELDVVVELVVPSAVGTVELLFGNVAKSSVSAAEMTAATVITRSTGAATVLLSNTLAFATYEEFPILETGTSNCSQEMVDDVTLTTCLWSDWNLAHGLIADPTLLVDGRYYVYARFLDKNGYEGTVGSCHVELDSSPPKLLSSSLLKYEEDNQENAILLIALDEPISKTAGETSLTVSPITELTPEFSGPARIGLSTMYQWQAATDVADIYPDKTAYSFKVQLADELGNMGVPQELLSTDGTLLHYTKGCDCSNGPCCDGCYFKPDTVVCDHDSGFEVGCPWGEGCGQDIGKRSNSIFCSGSAAECEDTKESWKLHEECSGKLGCTLVGEGAECQACAGVVAIPECPDYSGTPVYSCDGGPLSFIMDICAVTIGEELVEIRAVKKDGVQFGNRPYHVREFSSSASPSEQCKWFNMVKSTGPSGLGTTKLVFPAFDPILSESGEDAYCVTASTIESDPGHDGSKEQGAWYCSGMLVVKKK